MGESILILGGVRSGKTRLAERLASEKPPVAFVATATRDRDDADMTARIDRHRHRRPADWATIETPRELESVIASQSASFGAILIDCVTLWISNLMLGMDGSAALDDDAILFMVETSARSARVAGPARVVWVSNEVGSGGVASNALARRFADLQGLANQMLAAEADAVHLCVAGIPMRLK